MGIRMKQQQKQQLSATAETEVQKLYFQKQQSCGQQNKFLPNTRSSLMFLIQNQRPAGNVQTRMWRSKKKDTHVVGWCSDTDAMMGIWIFA